MVLPCSWAKAVGSCSGGTTRRSAANSAPPTSPPADPWTGPTATMWTRLTWPVATATTTVLTATACTSDPASRIVRRENRSASAPPISIVTRPPMPTAASTAPAPAADPVTARMSSGQVTTDSAVPNSETVVPIHQPV
nr:hypothetical protein [Nonomuraea terrae]